MKVLFVCRGNKADVISPIIKAQALSLRKKGIDVDIFPVEGKNYLGYFKSIGKLRAFARKDNFDIIHAHFGFTALMCSVAIPRRKLIVSLMGSEIYYSQTMRFLCRIFSKYFWKRTIVKSYAMAVLLKGKNITILPNGVDLETFYPVEKKTARAKLSLPEGKTILLFPSYPFRKEKNFDFIRKITGKTENVLLVHFRYEPQNIINLYYNAADVVVMASSFEGSPNTIKEAMACNCPIVATDVGDVGWVMGDTEGCFLSTLNEEEYLSSLSKALLFANSKGKTSGRNRIIYLGLSSDIIAEKLIEIYKGSIISGRGNA
ncbi:MAG TPA: glycosyltransferase family 4 protein [Bacteroidales bacterium]|nr:glycosyltransferase family 4 protein [Bacteroidales bacterium]